MNLHEIQFLIIGVPGKYRGEKLESGLEALGATYERVEGIDGQTLRNSVFEKATDSNLSRLLLGRELTKGEYGCANAHLLAYKRLIASSRTWAIVLEDDAELNTEFIQRLNELEIDSKKARVVQLYGIDLYRHQIQRHPWILNAIKSKCLDVKLVDVSGFWEYPERTHGYLINNLAAVVAVKTMERMEIITPADWPHEWRKFVTFSISIHQLIGLTQKISLIEDQRLGTFRASSFSRLTSLQKVFFGLMKFREISRKRVVVRCINSVLRSYLLSTANRFRRLAVKFTELKYFEQREV